MPLPDPPFDRAPKPRPFARRRLRHLGRRARRALPERDRRQARERRLQAGLCPDRAQEQVSLRPPRRPASRRARDLVREALDEDRRSRQQSAASRGRGAPPTSLVRIAQAAVAFVAIAAGGQLYLGRASGDLDTFSREQLGGVSPYLVEGHRNGKGHGHGFVGTLDNSWASLAREDRQTAAEMLVLRLREHGLEQVMIYDRDRALRIQAIGTQPVRAL